MILIEILKYTCKLFRDTHDSLGKDWSIGTKNCKQPFQCANNIIKQTRFNILITILATLKNCCFLVIRKKNTKLMVELIICVNMLNSFNIKNKSIPIYIIG